MLLAQNAVYVVLFLVMMAVVCFLSFRSMALMRLWFQAKMAGLPLNMLDIVGMRFRKVNPRVVVQTLIMAKQAGIDLPCDEVERAYLQGANLEKIAMTLIRAKREGTKVSFQKFVEADLEKRREA